MSRSPAGASSEAPSGPVLVTGATGFLGGRIAERLLASGRSVRLLHRSGRREALGPLLTERGARGRAEPVEGDVTDVDSLRAAVAGCSAVVHAAAHVSRSGPIAVFRRVNVGGLENVVTAAREAGVRRTCYTSSFVALGPSDPEPGRPGPPAGLPEEALGPRPFLDPYQASKHEAAILARRLQDEGAALVVLYPGVIVGPGPLNEANLVTGMISDHLNGRLVPLPDGGRRRWSLVHVDDVAEAHVRALEAADPSPAFCVGGENVSLAETFRIVERLTGRAAPRLSVPHPLPWLVGLAEEALEVALGRRPRQLTRGVARILRREWALDSSRAREELGLRPRSAEALVRDTITWLESAGHVPGGTLGTPPAGDETDGRRGA